MNTSMMKASIKKELWEFKGMLLWVPVTIMLLVISIPLLGLLLNDLSSEKFLEGMRQLAEFQRAPELEGFFFSSTVALFAPFILIGFIVQCYYFITCLFDERRDRSVMFWRSLPVSDGLTVAIKLFTGAIVIPTIFMSAATMLFILGLVVNLILGAVLHFGYDISLFWLLDELGVFSSLTYIWVSLIPTAIWLLPLFSWLMLTSIYAKKAPFLWAVLPIVALLIVEGIIVNYLQLSHPFFGHYLYEYFSITPTPETNNLDLLQPYEGFKMILAKVDFSTFIVSTALIYGTYWFRVNKSEV